MQNQKYSCYLLVSIFSRINSLLGATMRTHMWISGWDLDTSDPNPINLEPNSVIWSFLPVLFAIFDPLLYFGVCELGVPLRIHSSQGEENLYMILEHIEKAMFVVVVILERIESYLQNVQRWYPSVQSNLVSLNATHWPILEIFSIHLQMIMLW